MRRVFLYCMMIAAVLTACKNSVNEPNDTIVKDGKAKITLGMPKLKSGGESHNSARMIYGDITGSNIDFVWKKGDIVDFAFYDSSNQQIGTSTHTIAKGEYKGGVVEFKIDIPEGVDHFDIKCGPDELPTNQIYQTSGIAQDVMCFEKNGCTFTEETIYLEPKWSAIIIEPRYNFYFEQTHEIRKNTCACQIGIDYIEVIQTIGAQSTTIKYASDFDAGGDPSPITQIGQNGAAPTTPYVIVINPTSACDLSIAIKYNNSLFTGTGKNDDGNNITLVPNATISEKSMHTEGQSVANIVKGHAYEIESIKSHPLDITWEDPNY